MDKHTLTTTQKPVAKESQQAFEQILREGARRMLQVAIEAEVAAYIEEHVGLRDPRTAATAWSSGTVISPRETSRPVWETSPCASRG